MTLLHGKNYGRPTLDLNFAENKSLIDTVTGRNLITFSRSQSGKEATYVGSDGLIKYAGADEPRFDYDPVSGVCKGLLIEGQRTNGVFQSGQIGATPWVLVGSGTVNLNAAIAPDGTLTATRIQTDSYMQGNAHGFASNGCQSIFVKADSTSIIDIRNINNSNWLRFDIELGTITPIGASVVYSQEKIEYFANGWARISYFGGTGSAFVFRTIPNTETIFVWGAQAEVGSFPTSYIPTSGSTVTRNADNASITGTNFSSWYNQSEGTVSHVGDYIGNVSGNLYARNNGLIFNFVNTGLNAFTNQWSLGIYRAAGGSNPPNLSTAVFNGTTVTFAGFGDQLANNPVGSQMKVGAFINTSTGEYGHLLDGGIIRTGSNTNIPIWNTLSISTAYDGSVRCGHISRLTYWPKRLPDLELQQLTK